MKKILSILLAACIFISCAAGAGAASFSPATMSADELAQIRAAAESGNPDALAALGNVYYLGDYNNGISRDFKAALDCFLKAAEAGNKDVLITIATIYDKGSAGEKDPDKAYEWYKKAAEAGNKDAEIKLAAPVFDELRWKDNSAKLSGRLGEDMTIAGTGRVATPFYLDAPVENCSMLSMEMRVLPEYAGWPWGRYALYAWGLDGKWQNLDYFQIEKSQAEGEPRLYEFHLDEPISFCALAVVLAEDGMDFTINHEDTFYVDKNFVTAYSDTLPAPVFTPSSRQYPQNSSHVATSAYVNPYPAE